MRLPYLASLAIVTATAVLGGIVQRDWTETLTFTKTWQLDGHEGAKTWTVTETHPGQPPVATDVDVDLDLAKHCRHRPHHHHCSHSSLPTPQPSSPFSTSSWPLSSLPAPQPSGPFSGSSWPPSSLPTPPAYPTRK
ncbi:hypothetical protein F5Y16DRAFT_398999 [Xylariaceae sp. FL0255]|nr:hypothetical protein F5Y16DRAFT_398999 [Xylariaceae sp. FL0255]